MSNTPSQAPRIEQRLEELEMKAMYADDLLDALNSLVARQQRQIDLLQEEVVWLRQRATEGQPGAFRSLRDELPPHY